MDLSGINSFILLPSPEDVGITLLESGQVLDLGTELDFLCVLVSPVLESWRMFESVSLEFGMEPSCAVLLDSACELARLKLSTLGALH